MDRVTRSSAPQNNAIANDNLNNRPLSENSPSSAFARASAFIGNSVGRRPLAAPPSIAPPPLSVNRQRQTSARPSADFCSVESLEGEVMAQSVNNNALGKVDKVSVRHLPDGKVHLCLPSSVNDFLLSNFASVQSQNIDLSKVAGISLAFCKQLTGAALRVLSERFPALTTLDLTGCSQFNDNDLAHLAQMVNLDNLCLAGCSGMSKKGFQYLCSLLDRIEVLDLTSCPQVDDEVLASLPKMHELKHLTLTACTQFTDAGISELGKLKKLESLLLDQCTQISDVGLSNLHASSRFKKLTEINLSNCPRITKNGVSSFKQGLKALKLVNTSPV